MSCRLTFIPTCENKCKQKVMNMEVDQVDDENNSILEDVPVPELPKKRKTHIGPWRSKEEFDLVYSWLFGDNATNETKENASKKMTIWKIRRLNFTPASILSTLVLLDVQLKDNNQNSDDTKSIKDLQILYSSAFTRFLNYMSSITQTNYTKSMYDSARELGIEPFVVDLRHLCAHGQAMPSIDTLRRTSDYCLKWLKEYYWDQEQKNMKNVDSKNIRQHDITQFDENVSELFLIYDAIIEARFKGSETVNKLRKNLPENVFNLVKKYCNIKEETDLGIITEIIVKELSALVKREPGMRDLSQIYIEAFLKMQFFFECAANHTKTYENEIKLIQLNRHLFRAIAFYGFIENLFNNLISICENDFEVIYKRKGASFWANKIALGFKAFKDFKIIYKSEQEKNPAFKINIKTINTHAISKDVIKIYSNTLNIDIDSTLIFGDNIRRPWSLNLTRDYIRERISKTNEYTKDVLINCLNLVVPPFPEEKLDNLRKCINIYNSMDDDAESNDDKITYDIHDDFIYRLGVGKSKISDIDIMEDLGGQNEPKKYGIWSTVADGQDWHKCPLGKLIWE